MHSDTHAVTSRRSLAWITFAWLLWATLVLTRYYSQLGRAFSIGLSAWLADTPSLVEMRSSWPFAAFWTMPAVSEALQRAAFGVGGAILVAVPAYGLGAIVCRLLQWKTAEWRERVLYQAATGFSALSCVLLAVAGAGRYLSSPVLTILFIGFLPGVVACFRTLKEATLSAREADPTPVRASDRLWQAIAAAAVLIALVGALAPEGEFDALWYHLWLPKIWLQHGRLVDVPTEYVSLYPGLWELLFGAGMAAGGPVAAKLLHFSCLPLAALLAYQLTSRYVREAPPWLAAALLVTAPTVLWEASTAYVDLALTLHVGLAFYGLMRYVDSRQPAWFAISAVQLGSALATKHLALFVLLILTTGLALSLWLKDRRLTTAIGAAALLAGFSLLLPLPWYIRSWVTSGNPVFPELFSIFGAPSDRWDQVTDQAMHRFTEGFGVGRSLASMVLVPWNMTIHSVRFGGTFGPLFLLFVPVLAFGGRDSRVRRCLVGFVLMYLALWASPASSFQSRFVLPIIPVCAVLGAEGCAALAVAFERVWGSQAPRVLYGLVGGLLLLNLPPFTSFHEAERVGFDGWLKHVIHRIPIGVDVGNESQDTYLARVVPSYRAWQYVNVQLPSDAYVLTFSGGDHFYSERTRLWSDATKARPAVWGAWAGQERDAEKALRDLGVTHVLFDREHVYSVPGWTPAIAQAGLVQDLFEPLYEDQRFILYRIRWEANSAL